ncbi:MAG: nucleotidyltransferase domain-containing protein, partial [Burkholderiaceae bacterium]|nr:nucleotidyltransferase domain-containing protein [Burkholderiaceae bacterium]
MIDIDVWMTHFTEGLLQRFGNRVWFIGLQGSYAREEATEQSDIDVVVILDKLSVSDIEA